MSCNPPKFNRSVVSEVVPQENSTYRAYQEIEQTLGNVSNRTRLFLLALLVVVQFCLIINSSWRATPDSALYLGLGESLAAGRGYVFNGEQHTFVPPGYPLLVAIARLCSTNNFLNYRILMAIMGLLTAIIGYVFIRRLCGPNTALLVGGAFGVNHVLLYNSTLTLSDVPFAFFTLLALTALLPAADTKNRFIWTLVAACLVSLLPLIRVNGLGVAIAALFFLFVSWKDMGIIRRFVYLLIFFIVAFGPTLMWQEYKATFPSSFSEGTYYDAYFNRGFQRHLEVLISAVLGYGPETSYALTGLSLKTGVLEYIVTIFMMLGVFIAFYKGDRLLVPITSIQFAGLILSVAGSRYIIMLLPALYLFVIFTLIHVVLWIGSSFKKELNIKRVLLWVLTIVAVLNLGHNFITIIACRTPLEANGAQSKRSLPFFTASRWLKANAPQSFVLTTRTRVIHYLSGCKTIPLRRSGVAHRDSMISERDQVHSLLKVHSPQFFFTDMKESDHYSKVFEAIKSYNWKIEQIPLETACSRYGLYELKPINSSLDPR